MVDIDLDKNFFVTTCPVASVSTSQIADGYTTVCVDTVIVEDVSIKEPIILPVPVQINSQPRKGGASVPITYLVDTLKIKRSVTVTGHLSDDAVTGAFTKKSDLLTIFKYGGTFTIVWSDGPTIEKCSVNVTKYSFKEVVNAYVDSGSMPASTPVKGYDVMLQFIVGTDRGG